MPLNVKTDNEPFANLLGEKGLNYEYFLPSMQRSFVWKESQIENFFDSFLKGFPVGNLLVWEVSRDEVTQFGIAIEKFQKGNINHIPNEIQRVEDIQNDKFHLVLDGQQRLTALYIGFKGGIVKRQGKISELYINLAHSPNATDSEDGYKLKFLTEQQYGKEKGKENWFKCKDISRFHTDEELREFYRDFSPKAQGILSKLWNYFYCTNMTIPMQVIQNASPMQAVEIFSRVNSGGTSLKKGDILLSFVVGNSTKKIKKDIERLIEKWSKSFSNFDTNAFLSFCMLATSDNGEAKYEVSDFKKDRIKKIEKRWRRITKSIDKSIEKLNNLGYDGQKVYAGTISSLAYWFYTHPKHKGEDNHILDFIQRTHLTGIFGSGSTETKRSRVAKIMAAKKSFKEALDVLKEDDLKVTKDIIEKQVEKVEYGDNADVRAILQLVFDGFSCETKKTDIDHIYPQKGKFSLDKNKRHKLFNLQIISRTENEEKNDKEPQSWLEEKFIEDSDGLNKFKKDHFLPDNIKITLENAKKFEKERKKMLVEKLLERFELN